MDFPTVLNGIIWLSSDVLRRYPIRLYNFNRFRLLTLMDLDALVIDNHNLIAIAIIHNSNVDFILMSTSINTKQKAV